jgi:hypothetical protein
MILRDSTCGAADEAAGMPPGCDKPRSRLNYVGTAAQKYLGPQND